MPSTEFHRAMGETDKSYLERLDYDSKRDHGGNAAYQFIVVSIVLFIVTKTKFLSFLTVGYFFGGMFVAAILSVPTWLLKFALARKITPTRALNLRPFWRLFEWLYNLAITWCLFSLFSRFII
jgi:hypothetical protein